MTDPTKLSLPQIYAEAEAIAVDAQQLFGRLHAPQINWQPHAAAWSVGQCLEHLIVTNREFFPLFDQLLKGEYRATWWQRIPALPGLFGRLMIKALVPGVSRKFKAPPRFQPTASHVEPQIVNRFLAHQQDVIAKMRATEKLEPARIIITSPVSKLVVYSLLDAYRILVVHERRHFAQAQRVMTMNGFPA
jgi:hypothetical protein